MSWLTILRQVVWQRTAGYWLFWWSAVYTVIAIYSVFVHPIDLFPWIQFAWLVVCSLPLFIRPLARFLNTRTIWR